jgi:hypothetical protein
MKNCRYRGIGTVQLVHDKEKDYKFKVSLNAAERIMGPDDCPATPTLILTYSNTK